MPQLLTDLPPDPAAVARIRPVTVSGAIDEALRIVHDEPRSPIVVALLVVAIPLAMALYVGLAPLQELALEFAEFGEGQQVDFRPILTRAFTVTLPLLFLAYRVAEPLALGALVTLSAGVLTGQRMTAGDAIKNSLSCSVSLIIMWLLRWLCVQVGSICCYVPGILLAALFFCALPALVVERLGPISALGRSVELTKRTLGEAVLLVLLLGLIEIVFGQIAQILPRGLPQSVGIGLVQSCVLVLYAAAATVFYFSGRCQLENLDLQLWAQSLVRRHELDPPPDVTSLFGPQSTT